MVQRFSAARMADGYERVYAVLIPGAVAGADATRPTSVAALTELKAWSGLDTDGNADRSAVALAAPH